MTYETLIETIREIVNNELIYKKGLTLEYSLDDEFHKKLDEHFHYQTNGGNSNDFEHTDEFEVEIGGIIIKFIKNEKE
jgi:hypothetical protein